MLKTFNKIAIMFMAIGVFMLPNASKVFAAEAENTKQAEKELSKLLADKAHVTKLSNGFTVYVLPDERFPLVSTRLYVRVGSAYEDLTDAGISHFLEHMVFKGTEKRPNSGLVKEIEGAGGNINAYTTFDYTVYENDLPSKHWKLGMDIVQDQAFNSVLDAKDVEAEILVVLSELQRSRDNPNSRIFYDLAEHALKGTPYSHPILGFENTIKSFTAQSVRDYIKKYYQPQKMVLVVVGNVVPSEVLAEAQKLFGSLKNTIDIKPVVPIDAAELNNAYVNIERGPWNKVYIGMALPIPNKKDARNSAMHILATVLGGNNTSYLHKKYQYEKQLVDEISVGILDLERVSALLIDVQLDADKVETFWNEFVADMAKLDAKLFTDVDINRAKFLYEDSFNHVKQTLSGMAYWHGQLEMFYGGEQGERNIQTELQNVTREQIQKSIDDWIVPQRFNVSVIAPKDANLPDMANILHKAWPAPAASITDKSNQQDKETKVIELGEGRKLVLIPDATLPYTAVDFYMIGGDSLASPKQQGLANLVSDTLLAGTKNYTALELEAYIAERAASINAFAGRHVFGISMREPSRFNADLFDLFKQIVTEPSFLAEEVDRDIKEQIANIETRDESATGLAFSRIPNLLYGPEHPYGYKSLGEAQAVQGYTREMVLDFWKEQIKQPWVLAVAGDFDNEAVLNFAKSLPHPQVKAAKLAAPKFAKQGNLDLHLPERDQAHLIISFPTVPIGHEDAPGLELLQNALGGMGGPLFVELRDNQSLGYTVSAHNRMSPKAGFMFLYIGTVPEKIEQARKGFKDVIQSIQEEGLSAEIVQSAKNQMEGDYYRQRQSLGSRSSEAALLTTLGHNLDFKKDNIEKASKLTANDLQKLVKKYLQFDKSYEVVVTP